MANDIADFLPNVAPDYERDLARVNVAGGDSSPFYSAQLRSFTRDGGGGTKLVDETYGIRSLLLDAKPLDIDEPQASVHPPRLLRIHPRPRTYGYSYKPTSKSASGIRSRRLFLWSKAGPREGLLRESEEAFDILVTPFGPWPRTTSKKHTRLPALRMVDGHAEVQIDLSGKDVDPNETFGLGAFLRYDSSGKTLFGGLQVEIETVDGNPLLRATLVPAGIEFKGRLKDPTRDFGGEAAGPIAGTFRLECDTRGKAPVYLLRLVATDDQTAIDRTENRIATAMAALMSSPISIRYDKRPQIPPLVWQLDQAANGLSLRRCDDDFEMQIDAAAVDVRVKTRGISSDERGLANIFARRLTWIRTIKPEVRLVVEAGAEISAGATEIDIHFNAAGSDWRASLDPIAKRPFTVPLGPIAERLLPIYRAGGGVAPDASHAPYVFLPVEDGWLQIPLPGPTASAVTAVAAAAAAPATIPASAMSGRVFVSQGNTHRAVVLDDARGLRITIGWSFAGTFHPNVVRLEATGARGQLLGMLYASETSPTSQEALPSLRGGPASTRDLPVWFGAAGNLPCLKGVFDWEPSGGTFVASVDELPAGSQGEPLSWLPPSNSAYISSFALTQSQPSASVPSASRGLLPRTIAKPKKGPFFTLTSSEASGRLPRLSAASSEYYEFFSDPVSDRLVLPTLVGTEFRSDDKTTIDRTRLRFDVPVLDELMGWADPPRGKQIPGAGSPLSPTALQPSALAASWAAGRDRLALTRTQGADATGWIGLSNTGDQSIRSLVAPYTWSAAVDVNPAAHDGWGQFKLAGDVYSKRSAAEGLGGAQPVSFSLTEGMIEKSAGPIEIAGFAANLFEHKAVGAADARRWDSRGFGMSPRATFLRGAAAAKPDGTEDAIALLTSPELAELDCSQQESIWSFRSKLGFLVRDLPLRGRRFDGRETGSPECAIGTDGTAFDAANLPISLYEWRLFEIDRSNGPARHDIGWGPFAFKPLRLLEAVFDQNGAPIKIAVLGGMEYDPGRGPKGADVEGPYGVDRVYARNDLFQLTLTKGGDGWTYDWRGRLPKTGTDKLELDDRAATIEIPLLLEAKAKALFQWERPIDAKVVVGIDTGEAELALRLFGTDHVFEALPFTRADGGLTIDIPVQAVTQPTGSPGVTLAVSAASLSLDGAAATLSLDGSIRVHARADQTWRPCPLVSLTDKAFRWLGQVVPVVVPGIAVEHDCGVLSWQLPATDTGLSSVPFGFETKGLRFSASLFAVAAEHSPQTHQRGAPGLTPVEMTSVSMQVLATDRQDAKRLIEHQLVASLNGKRKHSLRITWAKTVTSPIAWPTLSQFRQVGGQPVPADWLDPKKAAGEKRSRTIEIASDDDSRLRHQVTFQFKNHRLDADSLDLAGEVVTVAEPIRLLAVAAHRLGSGGEGAEWTTLDHVVITQPALMAQAAADKTIAPIQDKDRYRGVAIAAPNGIVSLPTALSGFFDPFLVTQVWGSAKPSGPPIILGGAVVQFPVGDDGVYSAVVPWADLASAGIPITSFNTRGGTWQVASSDLWPGTAHASVAIPALLVSTLDDGAGLEDRLGMLAPAMPDAAPRPARTIPVEQAYFEKRKNGVGVPLVPGDLDAAPFFLRTMIALAARHDRDRVSPAAAPRDWKASTLHAAGLLHDGKATPYPANPISRVVVRTDGPPPVVDPDAPAFADLIVLSPTDATVVERYRRMAAGSGGDLNDRASRDELAEAAVDIDANALVALRVCRAAGGEAAIAWRMIERPFARLSKGRSLTPSHRDVTVSATLGWPTATGSDGLARLGPTLGDELPALAHEAGFAGRFQMLGWPAFALAAPDRDPAADGAADPAGIYLSFANHIVYDRGSAARLSFDGPAAHHLMPSIARRRAPTAEATNRALAPLLHAGETGGDGELPAHRRAAAILPPATERGTIGRRAGVIEVSVASLTVPAEDIDFDRQHARFGRPANAGPVAAHQLRNPRSPVLPDDLLPAQVAGKPASIEDIERISFGLRRRTYVSLADHDASEERLTPFLEETGNVDLARFETGAGSKRRHDRALFKPASTMALRADWDGRLVVGINAKALHATNAPTPRLTLSGRLEIGALSAAVFISDARAGPFDAKLTFDLADRDVHIRVDRLGAVQSALAAADGDTPLRLVLEIDDKVGAPPARLPTGPRRHVVLPLMLDPGTRRVLPVRVKTILFGDPSYDRQLASPTATATGAKGSFVLAADRKAYDLGATLHFAVGAIDPVSGKFIAGSDAYKLSIARLPRQTPTGDQPPPEPLVLQMYAPDDGQSYSVGGARVFELALRNLVSHVEKATAQGATCPLMPGDRLQLSALLASDTTAATIQVDVVADPVIAPPPAVFSVVETLPGVSRVRLHATAPLPQKVEFPDLLGDLALGHVRRRALFVWSFALAGAVADNGSVALLKFDRSGAGQFD